MTQICISLQEILSRRMIYLLFPLFHVYWFVPFLFLTYYFIPFFCSIRSFYSFSYSFVLHCIALFSPFVSQLLHHSSPFHMYFITSFLPLFYYLPFLFLLLVRRPDHSLPTAEYPTAAFPLLWSYS